MPNPVNAAALEAKLASPSLKSSELKTLLRDTGLFKGMKPPRWVFPRGIPHPDILRAEFELEPDQYRVLGGRLLGSDSPIVRSWRVFPLGIVNPERYIVQVDVGKPLGR